MSFGDWFRRMFSPSSSTGADEPEPGGMAGAPGISTIADLETAQAVEDIEGSTEAPSDPAQ